MEKWNNIQEWEDFGLWGDLDVNMLLRKQYLIVLWVAAVPIRGREYRILCLPNPTVGYTVKFEYNVIVVGYTLEDDVDGKPEAFKNLWRLYLPFRVKAFGWRTFLNRLSSKGQLKRCGILTSHHDLY